MVNVFKKISDNIKEKSPFGKRLIEAGSLADEGRYEEAIEILDIAHMRSTKPLRARAELLCGVILSNWGRNVSNRDDAKSLFKNACDCFAELDEKYFKDIPTRSSYYFEWASVLGLYGQMCSGDERIECYNKANGLFEKASDFMVDVPQLYNNWGGMLVDLAVEDKERNEFLLGQACKLFQKGAELDGEYANVFANWGKAFFVRAMQDNNISCYLQAKEKFEKALEIDSQNHLALGNLASVYQNLAMMNYENNAIELFELACEMDSKMLEIKNEDECALSNLANSYWNLAKYKNDIREIETLFNKALDCANRAIAINENNAEAYFAIGSIYLEKGFAEINYGSRASLDTACKYLQKAIECNSSLVAGYTNLGTAYLNIAKVCDESERKEMLLQSCKFYKSVLTLGFELPVSYHINYLVALFRFAAIAEGNEKNDALDEVISNMLSVKSLQIGPWMYNVACAYVSKGDKENGKLWLLKGEKENALESRDHALNDEDMKCFWDEEWFLGLRWKGE